MSTFPVPKWADPLWPPPGEKPNQQIEIDPDNEIAQKLIRFWPGNMFRSLTGQELSINTGTITSNDYYDLSVNASMDDAEICPISGSQNRTLLGEIEQNVSNTGQIFNITSGSISSYARWTVRVNASVGLRFEIEDGGYTSSLRADLGRHFIGCRLAGTTLADHTLFVDGDQEDASGTTVVNTGDDYDMRLGQRYDSGTGGDSVERIYWLALFAEDLSDEEIESVRLDPWQLVRLVEQSYASFSEATGGHIISVGLAAETNIANSFAKLKVETINQAIETDTAALINEIKSLIIGLINETDTAVSIERIKTLIIGLVNETDNAISIARVKTELINQVTESDTAQSIGRAKNKSIALAVESNMGFLLNAAKQLTINSAQENDSSFAVTALSSTTILLGLSSEIDVGLAINIVKAKSIIQALESDSSHPVSSAGSHIIGQALEADSATVIDTAKALNITIAEETDSSFIVNQLKQLSIGQALESDSSFPVESSIAFLINTAAELDSAFNLLHAIYVDIGMAEEFDSGLLIQIPGGGYIYACKFTANIFNTASANINDTIEANICS